MGRGICPSSLNKEWILQTINWENKMKILHWVGLTPNACGLYEQAKDQIAAERSVGIDSQAIDFRIVDNKEIFGEIKTDEWLTSVGLDWTKEADINVIHSGINEKYKSKKPNILMMHGRPEYAFMLAYLKNKTSMYQEYMSYRWDERYRKFITMWPEHKFMWDMVFPKHKMECIPLLLDTNTYNLTGKIFDLNTPSSKRAEFNILVADMWREDVTPYNVIVAAAKFVKEECPEARIHIVGMGQFNNPALQGFLGILKDNDVLGACAGVCADVDQFYRACDIMVSPQVICTRSVREATACGLIVVGGAGATWTDYKANPLDTDGYAKEIKRAYDAWKEKKDTIKLEQYEKAKKLWSPKVAGLALKKVYEEILEDIKSRPYLT